MKTHWLTKVLYTHASWSGPVLRVPLGVILLAHGAQKLFGWFGGAGLNGTAEWMANIGLQPGMLMALLAGGAEFFGGIALILGLLTRPAAWLSAVTMVVAIFTVHISHGLFIANGGYEFALALLAMSVALAIQGGGKWALDTPLLSKIK